ncbi:ABC transporter ATP-binding protein [Paenibacillus chitinolyticus]|uniref:ABC transporter ATP-binding protein n=1 Tax=Paenibacillus chitinolyticus TaxID=79263 RepID=UPI0038630F88
MIRFENVSKRYADDTVAVNDLNLEINEGEFFVFIGPSGCGKTTTLKMINRLIPLSGGTLWINGRKVSEYDIHELRWNIGYVLQQIALFPHMTIEENIAIVPEMRKWDRAKIRARVDELLDMVGLEPKTYRSRKPKELSGGQQQRVGVVRALAADPQIVLMDEPFSALDPLSRERLQNELLELQQRIKKTIVFVTHDMQEAMKLGDRICLMNEGEIVQLDTPQGFLQNPASAFVEQFVGGQKGLFGSRLTLEDVLLEIGPSDFPTRPAAIAKAEVPLEAALQLLADEEVLAVEKAGVVVGSVSRQALLKFMAGRLKEGART